MSVFTKLILAQEGTRYKVLRAQPWWIPNFHHSSHFVLTNPSPVLFLRLPFYDPRRPAIGDIISPSDLIAAYPG